jgi:hypothetical protein
VAGVTTVWERRSSDAGGRRKNKNRARDVLAARLETP